MAFIPSDAHWYLADIVLEHRIEGDSRNVVHVNTHLIDAASPELAYEKALALGHAAELEYLNTEGKQVHIIFRCLRQLNIIPEELEDGAELMYEEMVGIPEEELQQWVRPKETLGVFAPIDSKTDIPNYIPDSVMRMLEAEPE
ncbi:MAG TPA: DUF4288 domain-containing protein [Gemmataceae bacterium]|nr:DUF4288 domain-containing protein [Gemmataceae bacterium]